MSLFGQSSFGQPTNFGGMTSTTPNPMKDVEITNPPDDSISCLRFSPPSVSNASFLVAGSWDNNVRCWQIQQNGQSDPKSQQTMQVRQEMYFLRNFFSWGVQLFSVCTNRRTSTEETAPYGTGLNLTRGVLRPRERVRLGSLVTLS